jgi:hypothetical protein
MTGMFLKVKRADTWVNLEVEFLTPDEIKETFERRGVPELVRWISGLCDTIRECDTFLLELEASGTIKRKEDDEGK